MFGRVNNNITVLSGCMLFFLVWVIILIIRIVKKPSASAQYSVDSYKVYSRCKIIWICTVTIILLLITCYYGFKIYHNTINYNGKLSWFLRDLKSKRTVKFKDDNIYKNGIEGIFKDINKKVDIPKNLYVATSFSLKFDSYGKITSFDTYIYGKNTRGKLESYLITYDSNKSENITIYLNGYVNADYSNNKLLEPLIKTMKVIPLKKIVTNWPENQFGILYYGKRSFGYNTNGVIYIDSKGNINSAVNTYSEVVGYTVSVYVPGKESRYTPVRYNLTDGLGNIKTSDTLRENKKISDESNNDQDKFYLSKLVGYRLKITAAAAGSRSYSLEGTTDAGGTWNTINKDPFSGMTGVSAGITFLNNKLGFICLSHNGGRNGELYCTEDGGVSYTKVNFPEVKITLSSGKTYNPFDLPRMPYEEDGILNVLVGQGSDGDYNGGSKGLYQSKDNGITWKYVKESEKK
ncbi:WD40/YVTN/BNR-like repeat-containing protein [Clostridium pasteurianum]|nr:hypothetical protein [Clostridium pasteurianum]ELP60253.1 hypothetical protein F502_06437 [Clostridium pasteurianum DSM 525 = ATCC 6013]KRU11047.1 hypothetical protein CP6013_00294 [Clostridium pasteurianum DSM 525 = ATCC 6013]